jgi:tetratricopeptide (TPR) repeat protein
MTQVKITKRVMIKLFSIILSLSVIISLPTAAQTTIAQKTTIRIPASLFFNSYQYDYIDKHIDQKSNTIVQQLQNTLAAKVLKPIETYFVAHNLAYALFKEHKKTAALAQINKTIAIVEQFSLNSALPFDSYHLGKSLLLKAKTNGILFRDTKTAIKNLEQAILQSKPSQHPKIKQLEFDITTAMAQAYNQLGELQKAKSYINQALKTAPLLNNKNETIYALIISGRIAFQQDKFNLAYQEYLKALKLSDSSTPKKRIASIELRLAIAYEAQNIYDQALIHAKKAVTLYSQLSEERLQIKSLRVLGNIYLSLGQDIDTALVHFINGLTIAKTIQNPYSIGQMQHLIGRAYLLEHNVELAGKYLNSAEKILKKSKAIFYLGLNNIELAKLAKKQGKVNKAIVLVSNMVRDENNKTYPALISTANNYLLSLYVEQQQFKKAYFLQQQLLANNDVIKQKTEQKGVQQFNKNVESKILEANLLKTKSELKLRQQQIAQLNTQNIFYLLMVVAALVISFFIYLQNKKWQKRYHQRITMSLLTWPAFKNKITTAASSNVTSGLLFSTAKPLLTSNENGLNYQNDQCSDKSLHAITHAQLSDHSCLHHDTLWHICAKSFAIIKNEISVLAKNHRDFPVYNAWVNLKDFPQHLSEQSLHLIEKLSYYLIEDLAMSSATQQQWQLVNITIQTQALALIFSKENKENINSGIQQALEQGSIRLETINLI